MNNSVITQNEQQRALWYEASLWTFRVKSVQRRPTTKKIVASCKLYIKINFFLDMLGVDFSSDFPNKDYASLRNINI